MIIKELLITFISVFVVLLSAFSLPEASADMYLNSAEPMCNGSDPTVLLCDDFEDHDWVVTNVSFGTNPGPSNPANDGWGAVPTYLNSQPDGTNGRGFNPPKVPGYAVNSGAVGTAWAATSSERYCGPPNTAEPSGYSHAMMAEHDFLNHRTVSEIYVRWYVQPQSNYVGAQEKFMTNRDSNGNCCPVMVQYMWGPSGAVEFCLGGTPDPRGNLCGNQGNRLTMINTHWYYLEYHVKLNTVGQANGIFEMWVDDCGVDGRGCTGPGTLRTRYTDVQHRYSNLTLGNLWLESYSTPCNKGAVYYDQIIARTQRIGPMSMGTATTPPSAPQNLQVLP